MKLRVKQALCINLAVVRHSATGGEVTRPQDVRVRPEVEQKLWEYKNAGYLVFGFLHQEGRQKTIEDVHLEVEAMVHQFESSPFDMIKVSMASDEADVGDGEGHRVRSLLRMPNYGMLALCEAEAIDHGYSVDWTRSLLVGESATDQGCANMAGIFYMHPERFMESWIRTHKGHE